MRLLPIWTLAVAGLLLASWPAAAQQMSREDIELRNQIYELQQQVQALQQQVGQQQGGGSYLGQSGNYPPPQPGSGGNDLVAQLLTQVQSLEAQVRDLRGQIDETQNELKQQSADLNKKISDLAFQMQNPQAGGTPTEAAPPAQPVGPGQGPGNAAASAQSGQMLSPPPGVLGATQAPPPEAARAPQPAAAARQTPEAAIRQGDAALARHDYPAAEAAARDVLNNHRTSPRAYEAQYLLARSLEGQRRYAQAAIAYDDTYNRNRKGSLAPDALVGLANALTAINEKRAACDTLVKLHTEFPHESPALHQSADSVRQRAGCH